MSKWVFSLKKWFNQESRQMPWRDNPSPYNTWISEIMLQQTQVATVIPYFNKFINSFPTVFDLAKANIDIVLKHWEGLGYYSRARNLHKTADIICNKYKGNIPNNYKEIQTLPGIGPYAGAAIISIAYEIPVAVVDGNVLRVFTRFWGIFDDIKSPKVRQILFDKLNAFVGIIKPSIFNQAIMELGALICTPKKPNCLLCPLKAECFANLSSKQELLPIKSKSKKTPTYNIVVGLIYHNKKLLIAKRKTDQMLGGLWEFPGGKIKENESEIDALVREINEEVNLTITIKHKLGTIKHAYSHFKINLHAYICYSSTDNAVAKSSDEVKWINENELNNYAFPKANIKLFKLLKSQPLFN